MLQRLLWVVRDGTGPRGVTAGQCGTFGTSGENEVIELFVWEWAESDETGKIVLKAVMRD
jgi:hypothetical protein